MYHVTRIDDARNELPADYEARSKGFSRQVLVGASTGSPHMGLAACRLEAKGQIDSVVHSYENSLYVTHGRARDPPARDDPAARSRQLRQRARRSDLLGPGAGRTRLLAADERARPLRGRSPAGHVLHRRHRRLRVGRRARPARPAQPQRVPVRPGVDGPRPAGRGLQGGRAHGVGEHGDGAARLQRHRRTDARRPAPRRPAAHHVHGGVPADGDRPPARPPVRGGVHLRRGPGARPRRGRRARPAVPATSCGPASAPTTASTTARTVSSAGSRRRPRSRPRSTPTGSAATGSTSPPSWPSGRRPAPSDPGPADGPGPGPSSARLRPPSRRLTWAHPPTAS